MKKLSFLTGAVFALVLIGCSPSYERNVYQEKQNLTIDGNEIAYSGSVVIPAGTVTGGDSNSINGLQEGVFCVEGRNLEIPAFEIGKYEVTQRLYKAVMSDDTSSNAEPSSCKGDSNVGQWGNTYVYSELNAEEKDLRPVEGVTWFDAVYFCNKLSEKTGKVPYYTIKEITRDSEKHITSATVTYNSAANAKYGYRLPTSAEWEYAARGGKPSGTEWRNYFAGKASSAAGMDYINADLDSIGWYSSNSVNGTTGDGTTHAESGKTGYGTHRVGLKAPVSDSCKLYDMSGNVAEWCWDWDNLISATTPLTGPKSPYEGSRVLRGGSWNGCAYGCSVLYKEPQEPDRWDAGLGIRVVCSCQ